MQKDLVNDPILSTLIKMAIPMGWGILSIVGFNLADTYFLGQLGKNELAAISFTFPVVTFFTSLALGMATATSSLVSRALGEGNDQKIIRLTSDSLSLSFVIVLVSIIFGLLTLDPLFKALGANEVILPLIKEYMLIWYPGMLFVAIPMVGNGAIRARGDTKTAAKIMFVAGLTNVVLDPILIFGLGPIPSLGMKGAAIATVIARAMTLFASVYVLFKRYKMLSFEIPKLQVAVDSWKKILHITIPSAGSNVVTPLVWTMVTAIVAQIGTEAVAAFGVVSKIESFAVIVIFAISASVSPFVGQNYGARQFLRIKSSILIAYGLGIIWGVMIAIPLFFAGNKIVSFFNSDPLIIDLASGYFWLVPWSFGLLGMRVISCSAFNSIGKPYMATVLIVVHMVVLYAPLIIIGADLWQMNGVFLAQLLANSLAALASYYLIKRKMFDSFSKLKGI